MKPALLLSPLVLAAVSACSGGTDPAEVRAALDHPTGSISDVSVMVGAASELPLGENAIGISNVVGLQFLREAGSGPSLPAGFLDRERRLIDQFADGVRSLRRSGLDSSADVCMQAYQSALASASLRDASAGSFEASVDLSTCGYPGASGTLKLSGQYQLDPQQRTGVITVWERFEEVCGQGGALCIRGELRVEATVGPLDQALVGAWDIQVQAALPPRLESFRTRGGAAVEASDRSLRVREVAFVENSKHQEVSVSILVSSDTDALEISGVDGKTSCTWNGDRSGSCRNGVSWTTLDSDAHLAARDGTASMK